MILSCGVGYEGQGKGGFSACLGNFLPIRSKKTRRQNALDLLRETYQQYDKAQLSVFLKSEKQDERYTAACELQLRGGEDIVQLAMQLTQDIRYQQRAVGAFILG